MATNEPSLVFSGQLRDWFAGMALQGLLSEKGDEPHNAVSYRAWALESYALADAMMKQREAAR